MTVVRRPLQSMVCSGRLTICDLKSLLAPLNIVYDSPHRVTDSECQIGPTLNGTAALEHGRSDGCAYLVDVCSVAAAINHTNPLPSVPRRKFATLVSK